MSTPLQNIRSVQQLLTRTVPSPYVELIAKMKFYIEPEISCSRFFKDACFTEKNEKTELGAYVAEHLQDGLFVDIPCGLQFPLDAKDTAIAPIARSLGATEYCEVDTSASVLGNRMKEGEKISIRTEDGLRITTMQDDILGFVAKLSDTTQDRPIAFYISALQPDADFCNSKENQKKIVVPYLTALYDELARLCRKKDVVILNSSNMLVAGIDEEVFPFIHPAIALPQRGLQLMRCCPHNKVHVFKKEEYSVC